MKTCPHRLASTRFYRARCRTAFWSALRRWGERAIAAGALNRPRPQEWGYGSVHAARRARFKGFVASPRT